ncbi:MAG TPA: hypothetical protein VIC26_06590 [Marinagarivorans sp.]
MAKSYVWYFESKGYDTEDIRAISGGIVETSDISLDRFQDVALAVKSYSPDIKTKNNVDVNLLKCFHLKDDEKLNKYLECGNWIHFVLWMALKTARFNAAFQARRCAIGAGVPSRRVGAFGAKSKIRISPSVSVSDTGIKRLLPLFGSNATGQFNRRSWLVTAHPVNRIMSLL